MRGLDRCVTIKCGKANWLFRVASLSMGARSIMQKRRLLTSGQAGVRVPVISRRSWLTGILLGAAATSATPRVGLCMRSKGDATETDEIASVQALAKKAALGPFSNSRTKHFLGLGDAPAPFRVNALEICESLSTAFLPHFRERGFQLAMPDQRLTVITLKDKDSYGAFLGEDPGQMVGGHYDLDTNRLVMFDFRPNIELANLNANPERVNLLTLVHETTHLLCFNTGLLSRQTDVPDWVSEGLATYAELWQKNRKPATPIGTVNGPWLYCLRESRSWIAIPDLVAADGSFRDPKTEQLSYAESWLMVHYLMRSEVQRPKFRSYLAGLPPQGQGTTANRVAHAEKHLGSLKKLDRELADRYKRLAR
jgi:hypothetical protein